MKQHTLGEFEELVLLMVAAQHDEAYGVTILEGLEEKLERMNISAVIGLVKKGCKSRLENRKENLCNH
ncbi:MAG: hypothetical protein IPN68_04155 [Bacteroidetes bacterium]|nr:hypothetical protein [Bacteroidota bacterium]